MAFEVGKKYKRKGRDSIYNCLFAHRVAGGSWGTFDLEDDYIPRTHQWGSDWSEYKEPRKIEKWVNVYDMPYGSLDIGAIAYNSKEKAIEVAHNNKRLLDTVKFEYTEKVE